MSSSGPSDPSNSAGGPGVPPPPPYQGYQTSYGGVPSQPIQRPPENNGRVFTIIAFVFAAIALLFCPPLFGVAGIVLGAIGHSKGDPLGKWAIGAAAVCMVVGMILGALAADSIY